MNQKMVADVLHNVLAFQHIVHGRRKRVAGGPWPTMHLQIWYFSIKFLGKKVVFLVSSGKNEIAAILPPYEKIFLTTPTKIHYCPSTSKYAASAHDFVKAELMW